MSGPWVEAPLCLERPGDSAHVTDGESQGGPVGGLSTAGGWGSGDFQGFPTGLPIWGLGALVTWGHSLSIFKSQEISLDLTLGGGGLYHPL